MLVTDVGDEMCWDIGDRFRMLATDFIHGKNHQHNEKSRQHIGTVTNIKDQSPSLSHQQNDVTNITVTNVNQN